MWFRKGLIPAKGLQKKSNEEVSMKNYYLALEEASVQKTIYPLLGPATIGRSAENTIAIPHPTVSRVHAKLSAEDGVWTLEDLGSANGIIFDGNLVDKMVLNPGDCFQIGVVTFRFIEKEVPGGGDVLLETIEVASVADED